MYIYVNISLIYSWNEIYFRQKLYGKSKHILNSVNFPEYCAVHEIKWKNIVQPDRPQMTRWRMRIAYLVTNATDKHLRIFWRFADRASQYIYLSI